MVKTSDGVMDINPLERMDRLEEISGEKRNAIATKKKELEDFENSKKREFAEMDEKKRREIEDLDKKKQKELDNIDKKRKELQELEMQKIREIEETQDLIDRSFQELMRQKRIILKEEDEHSKKNSNAEMSLEEVAQTAPNIIPEGANTNYNKFFENLQEPQRLYDITNNTFYSGLMGLRNRAASGEITPEEEMFVERLKSRFEQFNNNETYLEKDQNQYVRRSMNVIEQIGKYHRLKD